MKKCPACAEEIQDEAKKCRYCGTELEHKFEFPQIGCGGAAILFILIALAYGLLSGTHDDDSSTSVTSAAPPAAEYTSQPVTSVLEAQITARDLINREGDSCASVTSLDPLGVTETGMTVHRANCDNGDQYVVEMTKDHRLKFISSCTVFEATSGKRC